MGLQSWTFWLWPGNSHRIGNQKLHTLGGYGEAAISLEPKAKGNLFKVAKILAFTDYPRLLYPILFDGLRPFSVRLNEPLIWLKGSRQQSIDFLTPTP